MANSVRTGFWPVGTLDGSPWNARLEKRECDASAENIFLGDMVKLEADGKVNVVSAVTDVIYGSVVGVLPIVPPNPQDTLALAGSTEVPLATKYSDGADSLLICPASGTIYSAESTIAQGAANVGEVTNITTTAGSTTTGLSAQAVLGGGGVGAAGQFKILAIKPEIGNETSSVNTKVLVMVNQSFLTPGTVGI